MRRPDSLEKTLMLGKIEGRRRRGQQKMTWLDSMTNSMDMNLSIRQEIWRTGKPGMLWSMGLQRARQDWASEWEWPGLYLCFLPPLPWCSPPIIHPWSLHCTPASHCTCPSFLAFHCKTAETSMLPSTLKASVCSSEVPASLDSALERQRSSPLLHCSFDYKTVAQ